MSASLVRVRFTELLGKFLTLARARGFNVAIDEAVNEPTAASMAYGLDRAGEYKILVFDLGGGTLDVTIMEFGGGTFTVLATSGDTQLGGTDMDNAIYEWIAAEFKKLEGIDIRNDKMAINRVKEAAEKAKIQLSTVMETEINLPYVSATQAGPKHLSMKLSRSKLDTTG